VSERKVGNRRELQSRRRVRALHEQAVVIPNPWMSALPRYLQQLGFPRWRRPAGLCVLAGMPDSEGALTCELTWIIADIAGAVDVPSMRTSRLATESHRKMWR